jgi:hypothetical protein
MPTRVQIENNLDNAKRYFANKMDKLVDKGLELNPEEISFENAVNNLFYIIEANEFMLKNNIDTDNETFLSVYKKMMYIIGVYANNLTKDNSLIIIGA